MTDIVEYCVDRLPALLRLLAGSDVELLEIQDGETRVRVHRATSTAEIPAEADIAEIALPAEPAIEYITSPLVGTFYRASEPGAAPYADVGSDVEDSTVIGYVEVLGEWIRVPAGRNGTIVEALATDGDAVEYGRPLFGVRLGG